MIESTDDTPRPLPRDLLPEATAAESAAEWQIRSERILAAAEPALRSLARRDSIGDVGWSTTLGFWWKPAAALAAAAVALLVMLDPPESARGGLPLNVVAAEGEPFALWQGLGIAADPVLALIAMEGQSQ